MDHTSVESQNSQRTRRMMKRMLLFVAICLPFLAATPGGGRGDSTGVPEFSGRINAFAIDLLRQQAAGGKNTLVSPLSVYSGLAMSYAASGGETRRGLARALHFPEENAALERDLAALRREMAADGSGRGVELRMADSVWLDASHAQFQKTYLSQITRMGAGAARPVDFAESGKACAEINAWVSRATNGRIGQSITPGDIASRSHDDVIDEPGLVIVDAVWMKGMWMHRFDTTETSERMFNTPGGGRKTPMMHQVSLFLYAEDARFKFLAMPYAGGKFSMLVLLPKEGIMQGAALAEAVSTDAVIRLLRSASARSVDVLFPKFTLRSRADLKPALTAMGAGQAFDRRAADFDAMIVKTPTAYRMYLASVRHDAWMEADEEGTEAAATTAATHFSVGCSAPERPLPAEFHADRPFLFFIVHNPSRSIVFAGAIGDPAEPGRN